MKGPKKIYLTKNLLGELRDGWDAQPSEVFTNIEYTRIDAFIDKACKWLESHNGYLRIHDNGKGVRFDMTQCVIDFRKAMKGE